MRTAMGRWGWIAAVLLLAACGDYTGAGQESVQVEGTWSGTRTEGAPSFPVGARPLLHAGTGSLTLTFVDNGDGTLSGAIHVDPDICWTANPPDGMSDSDKPQDAALTGAFEESAVTFQYTSPLRDGTVRLAGPFPPSVPWTGSYDGSQCGTLEDPINWVGDFTVTR